MRSGSAGFGTLVVAALIGCNGGGGGGGGKGPQGGGGRSGWTVLVYTAADNDLEPFALSNLEQMAEVGSSDAVRIVAQVDRAPAGEHTPAGAGLLNLAPWTTAKRLLVQKGSFQELSDLGEVDSADPARLADFIQWGVKAYPADRYMLVLWDHGGAWTGFGLDETVPGSDGRDLMDLLEIRSGVQGGLSQSGIAKLDVIGFDACLMASFEVAEALKSSATYLLASEETEPGHGWDYGALAKVAGADPLAAAKGIADGFLAIAGQPEFDDADNVTLSVVDLGKLAPVETALSGIGTEFGAVTSITPVLSSVGQGRSTALAFGRSPDPASDKNMVDLGDLFSRLPTLGAGAGALQAAVQGAVVYKVNGPSFARASGLSIHFPPEASRFDAARYAQLPGTESWRQFLSAYYTAAPSAPAPAFADATFSAEQDAVHLDGLLADGSLAALASAELVFGLPGAAGDAWLFGDQALQVGSELGGDHVSGSWKYTFLHLGQTAPTAHEEFGYLSVQALDEANGIAIVPLSYSRAGAAAAESAFRSIVFTLGSGEVLSDSYFLDTQGAVGELTPEPGSTLRARVVHLADATVREGTWEDYTSSGAFDATRPIDLEFLALSSGAPFFVGMRIENAFGAGAWVFSDVTDPPKRP